jgi:hypothetical protein
MPQNIVIISRINIHTLETPSSCTHEVAVPPNCQFTGLIDPGRVNLRICRKTL